jgi:ABC-type cobalamin/Fe3+-siderophores transport system ATPase subunit
MAKLKLKITKIAFQAGESATSPSLEINSSTVVILVGPNNSGKSLALREIENWCFGQDTVRKVIKDIAIDFPTDPSVAEKLLRVFETKPPPNQGVDPLTFWAGKPEFRQDSQTRYTSLRLDDLRNSVNSQNIPRLRQLLSSFYTVRLDGRTRFSLVDPRPTGDLQSHPQNHLWALFVNDSEREQVRKLTNEAFNLHFVIDPTAMQTFRVRMSVNEPSSKSEEQALDEKARNFHSKAQLIDELGDGVKTYTGLIAAILCLPHSIILVDEPEAFLHPPLARRLGYNLSKIAQERKASLIVATHSSEFLVGCMNAVNDVSVVRLTYERSVATARTLAATELSTIMCDPLMRSTNVLRALFSRAAVITESDADRAFYEEINRRLQSENRGIKDALFLNAQNVGTL